MKSEAPKLQCQDFALYHFQVDFNYTVGSNCLLHLMQVPIILFLFLLFFFFVALLLLDLIVKYFSNCDGVGTTTILVAGARHICSDCKCSRWFSRLFDVCFYGELKGAEETLQTAMNLRSQEIMIIEQLRMSIIYGMKITGPTIERSIERTNEWFCGF